MSKLPFLRLYTSDWLTGTRPLSLAAKGFLCDLLNYLWISDTRGALAGKTPQQLARMTGCTPEEAESALDELATQDLLTVAFAKGGKVTLSSQRMIREAAELSGNAHRQARFRDRQDAPARDAASNGESNAASNAASNGSGHGPVTAQNTEYRIQNTEFKNTTTLPPPTREAVRAEAARRGLGGGDADYFFDENEREGWQFQGEPIRSWKRWLNTWAEKGKLPSQAPEGLSVATPWPNEVPPAPLGPGAYIGGEKV